MMIGIWFQVRFLSLMYLKTFVACTLFGEGAVSDDLC